MWAAVHGVIATTAAVAAADEAATAAGTWLQQEGV